MINEIIQDYVNKIEAEKERLLFQRCVERIKTDEPINFTEEAKKRFPRIKCEVNSDDNSVHYYWNDGSDDGLHLISFYSVDLDSIDNNYDFLTVPNLTIKFSYK